MTWNEVFCNTFKVLSKKIEPEVEKKIDFTLPSMPMVNACRDDDFNFFQPLIDSGDLTIDQMHHAAQRYHLGKSRSGLPIFWMIDDLGIVYDGHLGTTWVSSTLKSREPLLQYWQVTHCLFGLHLLTQCECSMPINIVESEESAVILSELLPDSIWMSYACNSNLTLDLLEPLQGHTVTFYPRTDLTMTNYLFFSIMRTKSTRSIPPSISLSIIPWRKTRPTPKNLVASTSSTSFSHSATIQVV